MNKNEIVQIIDRIINETLPKMDTAFRSYVDLQISQRMRNQARLIFFDFYTDGKPQVGNPSEISTYQNKTDGSRWWFGGGVWHKVSE